jgi:hypothetical protein
MAMQLNLVAVMLDREFRFTPLLSSIVGWNRGREDRRQLRRRAPVRVVGAGLLVGAMLGLSAHCVGAVTVTHAAGIYVTLTVSSALFAIGVWPVVGDGARARVMPAGRRSLSTALAGLLLHSHEQSTLQRALDGGLLGVAAACAPFRAGAPDSGTGERVTLPVVGGPEARKGR